MNPEISAIIPAYNAEKTIGRCLDSILRQVPTTEIIIIDDCSTDNTYEICKEYQNKYSNIKLVRNQENIGQGLSRNKGIDLSKGDYIAFVDSDDIISCHAYEDMYSLACGGGYDIARCRLKRIYEFMVSSIEEPNRQNKVESVVGNKAVQKQIVPKFIGILPGQSLKDLLPWHVGTYLYRRVFIIENNIRFSSEREFYGEDLFFNLDALVCANSYISTESEYYFYIDNPSSTVHKFNDPLSKCERLLRFSETRKNQEISFRINLSILNSLPEGATQLGYDSSLLWKEKKAILKTLNNHPIFRTTLDEYPIHKLKFYMFLFFLCAKHDLVTFELICAHLNNFRMWVIKHARWFRDIVLLKTAKGRSING